LSEAFLPADRTKPERRKRRAAPEPRKAAERDDEFAELALELDLGWLFIDIHRLLTKAFESRLKELGLTRSQWRVMFVLKRSDETPGIMQTDLAELAQIEKAPLGKILDRLEQGGWIVRKKHPTDRRARLVYATSKIEKFRPDIAAAAKAAFAQTLKGVRQHEVKDLVAQLQRLKRNLGGADD
jgi:MarR family transcriptional regulator, transcriptional regulator for hemolysin